MAKGAATRPEDPEQRLFHCVSKVYRPEARYAPAHSLGLIRQECWREEALTIRHTDKHGSSTLRTILPLAIVHTERTLRRCREHRI